VSGAPGKSGLRNSPASGIHFSCSAIIHRTVRCICGATAISAPTATCSAFIARQRAQKSGTPMLAHRTPYSTCPVCHRTSRRAQKTELQRSNPTAFGDVAGAPDMSGVHRTVRCTRGLLLKLVAFGKFQRQLSYNSPDCPVLQGRAASGTRLLRESATTAPL
jgi:hypothetical protein